MISNPADYVRQFHDAGPISLPFHFEAVGDPDRFSTDSRSGLHRRVGHQPADTCRRHRRVLDQCDSVLG
jgi:pentose-5-phosphate-3-epimerase